MKTVTLMKQLLNMTFLIGILFGQTYSISGQIKNNNGKPLIGANVWISGTSIGSSTDLNGQYLIKNIKIGTHKINAAFIGYRTITKSVELVTRSEKMDFVLPEGSIDGDEVIVSASRRHQKIVDAPSTVAVVNSLEIRKWAGFSYANAVQHIKGINIYRTGIDGIGINARGFMTGYNYRFQLMTDGMSEMMIGNGLSAANMNLIPREDIDRIEVILGPSSALYGPNAHNGLLNVITFHPRDSQGGTLVIGAGQNSILNVRGRYASAIGPLAYKINAEYLTGKDFDDNRTYWIDANQNGEQETGEYTVEGIDSPIEHQRLNVSLYYNIFHDWELAGGYDFHQFSTRNVTNIGHNVIKDWQTKRWFMQLSHPRIFARIHSIGNLSDKYYQEDVKAFLQVVRGLPEDMAINAINLVDKSNCLSAEIQGNFQISTINIISGFNWDRENPVSERTVLLDRGFDPRTGEIQGEDIIVDQFGIYTQIESALPADFNATLAFRYDMHDNYESQFSPRLGLTWTGLQNGNFRVTWNQAFQAPAIAQQYLYIYIPGSRYQCGNGLGFTLADETKINPLKPETNETLEFGYKGLLANNLYLDVNYYLSRYQNFISGFIPVGPAILMGEEELDPSVPLLTYLNFGDIKISGLDVSMTYPISNKLNIFANYSYINQSNFDQAKKEGLQSADSTFYKGFYFNTPTNKWTLGVRAKDVIIDGLDINAHMRHVNEYEFVSGRWKASNDGIGTSTAGNNPYYLNTGPLGGFYFVDVSVVYNISNNIHLQLNIENLFDEEAYQMIGSPSMRRLINAELKYTF
ncbi:MAG: TonB-dependent receptor [Planctomycetia bacterium]|nr:TonB-dependent receptor [Planctomycetia bacterium]